MFFHFTYKYKVINPNQSHYTVFSCTLVGFPRHTSATVSSPVNITARIVFYRVLLPGICILYRILWTLYTQPFFAHFWTLHCVF